MPLHVCDHPLVAHRLTTMRDKDTPSAAFRAALQDITRLMAYPLLVDLPRTTRRIETPLTPMDAPVLGCPPPAIVAILRAGLGMTQPLSELLPEATFGYIGLYRDHDTHRPHSYYLNLPKNVGQPFILCDPMLATGYSAKAAVEKLLDAGITLPQIRLLTLVSAPEGVAVMADAFPDLPVFTAALDTRLNENAYIVPGLGDAGDRCFGTV